MNTKFNQFKQWFICKVSIIACLFLATVSSAQSVSIASSANPICAGTLVIFTATPSGAPTPSFAWYLNGSFTGETNSSYSNIISQNGQTIVCYMFYDGLNYASNTITMSVVSPSNYYFDADGDGFGAGSPIAACSPPSINYVTNNLDCNDGNFNIRPTATEIRCNGIDENCNGMADDTGPEIGLLGLSLTIPDGSTAVSTTNNTDYGNVTIGSSADHTFQITNTGSQVLTLTNISATNNAEFNANQSNLTFPLNIGVGNTLNFIVRFSPTTCGIRTTTLNIFSNDCDEATYNINLQGSSVCGVQIMGGLVYNTLQQAINAAVDGNTIIFLQNITASNLIINKSVILNAGAFTLMAAGLTIPSGKYMRWLTNTLTIPTSSVLSNLGTLWNNGAIMHPEPYNNQGIYKGTGTFNGNFTNNGSLLPGN